MQLKNLWTKYKSKYLRTWKSKQKQADCKGVSGCRKATYMKISLIFFLLHDFSPRWPHLWSCTTVENMSSWNSEKSSFLAGRPRMSFFVGQRTVRGRVKILKIRELERGSFNSVWELPHPLAHSWAGITRTDPRAQSLSSEPTWADCLNPKYFPENFNKIQNQYNVVSIIT